MFKKHLSKVAIILCINKKINKEKNSVKKSEIIKEIWSKIIAIEE